MLGFTSKLPNVGTTIFTEMSVLANQHNAINLGQGFPNFSMNDELVMLVNKAMQNGNNQYTHSNGLPLLRQRLAQKSNALYGATVKEDTEITITPGGTYAMYTALTTIIQPGDEVIVFEPAYDSYIPNIEINGGIPVLISLQHPNYAVDWEMVQQKITPKTKAIIINTPHNPTGSILNENDMVALAAIVKDTNIFIISDEVYEHLIFDNKKHESILRYPDLFARSFICYSFGKVYHCTGWKLGYCIAPASMMKEFRKVHQFNCFTCNTPMQYALAEFIQHQQNYLQLGAQLQQKRDYFTTLMQQTKFTPLPTYGSYFQLYSYQGISEKNEKDFAIELTKSFGVATIPASAFYKNGCENNVLRFCFVKEDTTLQQAADRLQKV
jgi:methionine transaminase